MPSDLPSAPTVPALVLTGGGARSAYQVGVLKAAAELLPGQPNPFRIILGTSGGRGRSQRAGSTSRPVARGDRRHRTGVGQLPRQAGLSRGTAADAARRTALDHVAADRRMAAAHTAFAVRQLAAARPADARTCPGMAWPRSINGGHLDALGLCATGYSTARSVTHLPGARRHSRMGAPQAHRASRPAGTAAPHGQHGRAADLSGRTHR